MISRSTWVLLAVFGVLLAVFYFSQQSVGDELAEATPTAAFSYLLQLTEDEIERLEITDAGGQSIAIRREADANWTFDGRPSGEVDQARISSSVRQLTTLRLLSKLEGVQDIAIYGLANPAYRIKVVMVEGIIQNIAIGDATPTGGGYYAQIEGQSPRVVNGVSLDVILDLLGTPPLLPTPVTTETMDQTATPEQGS